MSTTSKTFTAVDQTSDTIQLAPMPSSNAPARLNGTYVVTGIFVATLVLEKSLDTVNWAPVATITAAVSSTLLIGPEFGGVAVVYRIRCTSFTSGRPIATLANVDNVIAQVLTPAGAVAFQVKESGPSAAAMSSPAISGTPTGKIAYDPGALAVNSLRVASDVVSAETVTIGTDVYEVDIVNTDSTDTCLAGSFNTTDQVSVAKASYPHLLTVLNSLIRIENEMLRLIGYDGTTLTYARGASGTTAVAHVNTTAIYISDGVTTGRIPVGLVTTLTPTAFTAALVADINAALGTSAVTAVLISVNEILLKANAVGAVVLATTETLAGANNAWAATAMYGGAAQAVRKQAVVQRVPKALDVTLGAMKFAFDFTPAMVQIFIAPTATPGAYKIWDGVPTITLGVVAIDNAGSTDWAATDTVTVIAWGSA